MNSLSCCRFGQCSAGPGGAERCLIVSMRQQRSKVAARRYSFTITRATDALTIGSLHFADLLRDAFIEERFQFISQNRMSLTHRHCISPYRPTRLHGRVTSHVMTRHTEDGTTSPATPTDGDPRCPNAIHGCHEHGHESSRRRTASARAAPENARAAIRMRTSPTLQHSRNGRVVPVTSAQSSSGWKLSVSGGSSPAAPKFLSIWTKSLTMAVILMATLRR